MVRGPLVLLGLALTSAGFTGDGAPARTPDGPATLWTARGGTWGLMDVPSVLDGVRIHVGPGGQGGRFRLRIVNDAWSARDATVAVTRTFTLPAVPGTYTYPTPRVHYSEVTIIGVDQERGGLAIVRAAAPATAEDLDSADLEIAPPLPAGGNPAEAHPRTVRGRALAIEPILDERVVS
jgi:hypothetical protein